MELAAVNKISRPIRVIQYGEGNFLRAFADEMIDIANEKGVFDGRIALVKPRPVTGTDRTDQFRAQNCNYTVLLRGNRQGKPVEEARVVTSVGEICRSTEDYELYSRLAELDSLQVILSNTTEAGISYEPTDRLEDCPPKSYPGKLTKFLYERFQAVKGDRQKGLLILPTELIEQNGEKLSGYVRRYIESWGLSGEFLSWLEESCIFCNTLVDRIVSGYPEKEQERLAKKLGYDDPFLTVGESFALWVIEGRKEDIPKIRALFPLDRAGLPVVFTDSLEAYREQKVRILNGAHTSMVLGAFLAGKNTVLECMEESWIQEYLKRVFREVLPYVPQDRDRAARFAAEVLERFQNPFLQHRLLAIALNSVSKWKARILPSLRDYVKDRKELPDCLVFSFAALAAFYTPALEQDGRLFGLRQEEPYEIEDTDEVICWLRDYLLPEKKKQFLRDFAGNHSFWGEDLTAYKGFTTKAGAYYEAILKNGVKDVMEQIGKK